MLRVVTAEEMRWCDETTITKARVPGVLLMEHAGAGVAQYIQEHYAPLNDKHIVLCCGKGNNGGDGFVVARFLAQWCRRVTVLLLSASSELKGDARTNYDILYHLKKTYCKNIEIVSAKPATLRRVSRPDIIVDALFGTGFRGTPKKKEAEIIQWMNTQGVPVIAVDIPSGVDGTTGRAATPAVKATAAVTFGCMKTGLLCNEGRLLSGKIHLVDIGIPHSVTNNSKLKYSLLEASDVQSILPLRSLFAHKYSVGKVLVLAGSRGLTGAAALSSLAAFRSGAGAVVLGTPEAVYPILAKKLTEVMVHPLPSTAKGTFASDAIDLLAEKLSWADVVLLGPGIGQTEEIWEFVVRLLSEYKGKMVLDADALNLVAQRGIKNIRRQAEVICTPHVGEFSRLLGGVSSAEIETHRLEFAQRFAITHRLTLLLKGVPTVTASAEGLVVINSTGNPGMATAGSGDVLAGLVAGLWAQGMTTFEAAYSAAYIHGAAGDAAACALGEKSLLASDILHQLPSTLKTLERGLK